MYHLDNIADYDPMTLTQNLDLPNFR